MLFSTFVKNVKGSTSFLQKCPYAQNGDKQRRLSFFLLGHLGDVMFVWILLSYATTPFIDHIKINYLDFFKFQVSVGARNKFLYFSWSMYIMGLSLSYQDKFLGDHLGNLLISVIFCQKFFRPVDPKEPLPLHVVSINFSTSTSLWREAIFWKIIWQNLSPFSIWINLSEKLKK